jgi:hypothetical protein
MEESKLGNAINGHSIEESMDQEESAVKQAVS